MESHVLFSGLDRALFLLFHSDLSPTEPGSQIKDRHDPFSALQMVSRVWHCAKKTPTLFELVVKQYHRSDTMKSFGRLFGFLHICMECYYRAIGFNSS